MVLSVVGREPHPTANVLSLHVSVTGAVSAYSGKQTRVGGAACVCVCVYYSIEPV